MLVATIVGVSAGTTELEQRWALTGQARANGDPSLAHGGSGFVDFDPGGFPRDRTLTERISIPASGVQADFSFWLQAWSGPDALFQDRRDFLVVDILDANGRWLRRIG